MKRNCENCKHAVTLLGAYTETCYIECRLEHELLEGLTAEEILKLDPWSACHYEEGEPTWGGVTFDD